MKTLKQQCIENITEKLGWLKNYIELNTQLNLNDINVVSEDFFCNIMNMVYGYNLINLNKTAMNYPGIDLGDTNQKISIQVTSDRTRSKVEKTLETFKQNNYIQQFNRLIFLILGTKTKFSKPFDSGKLSFDPAKDVIDIGQLVSDINNLQDSQIKEISDYIEQNLIISSNYVTSLYEDFLSKQYKTVFALCLTKLKAMGIDHSTAHDIITNGITDNPYIDIENVNYLVGGFGCGKSHSLYLFYLYLYNLLQKNENSQLPIFFEAKDLLRFESIDTWALKENLHLDNCILIIDGLDELEYDKIEVLMHELDFLSNLYPNFKVIVGSREMTILAGKNTIYIPQLSLSEINTLYCQINKLDSYHVENRFNSANRNAMLKMLSKPFFAIIYSIYMKDSNNYLKNEMDLVSLFINKSIQPYIIKNPNIYETFDQLAILSIDRNLGYIHRSEIKESVNCDKLLSSGFFITDGHGNYTFSLPIVAQWIGAHAIRNNCIDINEILNSKDKVIKWRYSLSILFSQITYEESANYFSKIVLKMPGIASIIVRDGINFESAIDLPSADICGKRIYECMSIWLKALKGIDFNLQKDGIRTNTLAYSQHNNLITYSWADDYLNENVIIDNLDFPKKHFNLIHTRSVPPQATWPWIITFEELSSLLEKYIKEKHWILLDNTLGKEYIWKNALKLLHKGSLYSSPIPLHDLEKFRPYSKEYLSFNNNVNVSQFFMLLDSLDLSGQDTLLPSYVIGDKDLSSGWIWGNYSKEKMLERITKTYYNAICDYKTFIESFFSSIKEQMSTYLILPCEFVGILQYEEDGNDFSSGPAMTWYMSPLLPSAQNRINISYNNKDEIWNNSSIVFDNLKSTSRKLRAEHEHFINFTIHGGRCFDSSETPTTDIIYSWLTDDLKKIGWLK